MRQEMTGFGMQWTICKQSATRCRQITTPTPHYRPNALADAQPTVSKHWRQKALQYNSSNNHNVNIANKTSSAHRLLRCSIDNMTKINVALNSLQYEYMVCVLRNLTSIILQLTFWIQLSITYSTFSFHLPGNITFCILATSKYLTCCFPAKDLSVYRNLPMSPILKCLKPYVLSSSNLLYSISD